MGGFPVSLVGLEADHDAKEWSNTRHFSAKCGRAKDRYSGGVSSGRSGSGGDGLCRGTLPRMVASIYADDKRRMGQAPKSAILQKSRQYPVYSSIGQDARRSLAESSQIWVTARGRVVCRV